MHIAVETLDDALLQLYPALLSQGTEVTATRGDMAEIVGVLIEIQRTRARLSRSHTRGRVFSSLGELLWYLSRDNSLDFIARYLPDYSQESEDGQTVYGGYGPRLFGQRGHDQVQNVIALLTERPTSRRAVIQLFNAEDIAERHDEIPCTTNLQFLVRNEVVHLIVTMRSNDAYIGLPHDVFCFTALQELVARSLGRDIGSYRHFVGSMHLYERDRDSAQQLVDEGYQSRIEMPAMPVGNPWSSVEAVLAAEARIRREEVFDAGSLYLDPYWSDLIRLVQVFFSRDAERIARLRDEMSFAGYRTYINTRLARIAEV